MDNIAGPLSWILLYLLIGAVVAAARAILDQLDRPPVGKITPLGVRKSPWTRFIVRMLTWPVAIMLALLAAFF